MHSPQRRRQRHKAAEELILRTVAANADSLLRTARRFSLCPDDAQDAYQRGLEIFMAHVDRLDAAKAAGWLHVVVKREAQAIRRSRQKLVASDELDLDAHEARSIPTSDEQIASFDLVGRAAEALQRLKPQELRALWLKAEGHSYNEICELTGWSYTKVNRCLTEGRRSFLDRYATIESGAECERWLPIISAMVDGEATPDQLLDLRPHLRNCPGCRTTLATLQNATKPLSAILPIPLVAAIAGDHGDHVVNVLARVYELILGGVHDRAAPALIKAQSVIEATAAGKAAAIAGAAAAVAGGGYATIERSIGSSHERPLATSQRPVKQSQSAISTGGAGLSAAPRTDPGTGSLSEGRVAEFQSISSSRARSTAPEFAGYRRATLQATATPETEGASASEVRDRRSTPHNRAPEFSTKPTSTSPEFGP